MGEVFQEPKPWSAYGEGDGKGDAFGQEALPEVTYVGSTQV